MSFAMTKAERETFLAETRVAILSIADEGRGPLSVPVWYEYQPGGEVRIVTLGRSEKAALVRRTGRVGLCVQSERPPYAYVSVEGPVVVGKPDLERDVRGMAFRYLGQQMGEGYLAMTAGDRSDEILLRLRPTRWRSADFRKMTP